MGEFGGIARAAIILGMLQLYFGVHMGAASWRLAQHIYIGALVLGGAVIVRARGVAVRPTRVAESDNEAPDLDVRMHEILAFWPDSDQYLL